MTDHSARPERAATSRIAALHEQCRQDYIRGKAERAAAQVLPSYGALALTTALPPAPAPTDLDVAIGVAQQLLGSGSVLSLREALRLLLRALGAEPTSPAPPDEPPAVHATPAAGVEATDDEDSAVRRSVDAQFPIVAAFLSQEDEGLRRARQCGGGQ